MLNNNYFLHIPLASAGAGEGARREASSLIRWTGLEIWPSEMKYEYAKPDYGDGQITNV